jgi:hypothetical protein
MTAAVDAHVVQHSGFVDLHLPIEMFLHNEFPGWTQPRIYDLEFIPKHQEMPPYVSEVINTVNPLSGNNEIHVLSSFQFSIPSKEAATYKQTYKAAEQTLQTT